MHTRMTSVRSIPSSFDSSSGVRWFAISLLSEVLKNPPARAAPTGQSTTPIWCSAGIRGPASPSDSSSPRITVMVNDARTDGELPGFDERFADVRGCRLRYLLGGEGDPLLLVHGLGGAAANWLALAPLLLPGRRVLIPELPGHGGSAPLPAAPSLNGFADRIALLAEREGLAPTAVVGHSLGGAISLRMAIRRPDLVNALVLAGAAGISSGTRRARYALTMTGLLKPGRRIAPYRAVVARSAALRTLVFGRW